MKIACSWIILRTDNSKKQILLVKRGSYTNKFPHYWSFPWWKQEDGEDLKDTVKREVKEEINLSFTPENLFYTSEINWIQLNRFLWTWKGEIKVEWKELDWYAWYIFEEIKNLKIAFDNKVVLDLLKRNNFIL